MSETKEQYNEFKTWALVEIMGHQRYAGFVTEQTIAGSAFLRVDVPTIGDKPAFTKLFSPSSVYAITPCAEDLVKSVAESLGKQPMSIWDLPESLKSKLKGIESRSHVGSYDGDDDDVDPYDGDDDDIPC